MYHPSIPSSVVVEPPSHRAKRVRRVNARLLVITLVGVVALGVSLHVIHGIQVDRTADVFLKRANAAKEQGDIGKAIEELSQYVRFRPKDSDALAQLGRMLSSTAETPKAQLKAYLILDQVIQRDPNRGNSLEIRANLAELAMSLRRYDDAVQNLAILQTERPDEDRWLLMTAECREQLGKLRDAAQGYLVVMSRRPQGIEAYTRLIAFLTQHKDDTPRREDATDRSITSDVRDLLPGRDEPVVLDAVISRIVERMSEKGQPTHEALIARAKWHQAAGRLDEAGADLSAARRLQPTNLEILSLLSELSIARAETAQISGQMAVFEKHLASGRKDALEGLAIEPTDLRFYLTLSRIEQVARRTDDAVSHLRAGIAQLNAANEGSRKPTSSGLLKFEIPLRWSLADLLITSIEDEKANQRAKTLEEISQLIDLLTKADAQSSLVEFLKARLLIIDQKWHAAGRLLDGNRGGFRSLPGLLRRNDLLLAECYRKIANPDSVIAVFRRALKTDPLWIVGRQQLALALSAENRINDALDEYQTLAKITGTSLALAELTVRKQLSLPPERRDWTTVMRLLDSAEETHPGSVDVIILRAAVLTVQRKFDEAQQTLQSGVAHDRNEPKLWAALIRLSVDRDDQDAAAKIAAVEKLVDEAPEKANGVELRLAAASLALLLPPDDGAALLKKAEITSLTGDGRVRLLDGLARLRIRMEAPAEAGRIWRQLSKERPLAIEYWLGLASVSGPDAADFPEILRSIRLIEGSDGPNGNVIEAKAVLDTIGREQSPPSSPDSLTERLQKSRTLLESAAKQRPLWSTIPRLQGVLELAAGHQEDAVIRFKQAFDLGDRSRQVVSTIVEYYRERRRLAEADQILKQLIEENPAFVSGDLARLAWQVAWHRQQYDDALRLARGLAEQSGNYNDRIWNAHLLFARYQMLSPELRKAPESIAMMKEAEALYKGAVEQAPDQPSAWFAYIYHLAQVGRSDQASDAFQEASRTIPKDPKYLYLLNLGRYLEVLGKPKKAEEQYLEAVAEAPEQIKPRMVISDYYIRSNRPADATGHLEELLNAKVNAPAGVRSWAKTRKAMSIAARGGYEDSTRALDLLKGVASDDAAYLENLRARISILLRRPTHRDRLALIGTFEELDRRGALQPHERFQLAQIHNLAGAWSKSKSEIEVLLATEPANPAYLSWYGIALVKHRDDPAKVEEQLAKLREIEPKSFRTKELESRVLAQGGNTARAAQLLKEKVQITNIEEKASAAQLDDIRSAAQLCEEFRQLPTAEALFRTFAERSPQPEAALVLAGYLGRQGNFGGALDVCEAAKEKCSPELTSNAAANAVSLGRPTDDHLTRAERLVEELLKSRPDSSGIRTVLAGIRTLKGQRRQSEEMYRVLLEQNRRNPAALNNLAFLLALERRGGSEAQELIDRAIELAGPVPAFLDTRAVVHLTNGRVEEALSDIKEAISVDPSPQYLLRLAQAQVAKGDRQAARAAFQRAISAGLTADRLHPLELDSYRQLASMFADPAT